jgi:pimeloyl-ACP methyl ester carboxylesterase
MLEGFQDETAEVNGVRLHYVIGGEGDPMVLCPGWPRTVWQFHKIMPKLAENFRVIAVDLRGMGDSDKPEGGYDKKTMARDVFELIRHLGYESANVAGEDIGSMVAFSFAANHPEATRKLALWEPGHPTEAFLDFPLIPQEEKINGPFWFSLNQVKELPERLLEGRYRTFIDWLIDYQAKDPEAFSEETREIYAAAYNSADAIRASNGWYQAFTQDIADAKEYPVLPMPVLAIGGIYYGAVGMLTEGKAADLRFVEFPGAGHYLAEERPNDLVRELTGFFK